MTEDHAQDSQLLEFLLTLLRDLKFAARSLAHVQGLAVTVVLTLALGIGANAPIFGVVRGALLRPLVNRDEDRLIYIRQSARGMGADNAAFSVGKWPLYLGNRVEPRQLLVGLPDDPG